MVIDAEPDARRGSPPGIRIATGPLPRVGGVRTHVLGLSRYSRYHPVPFEEPVWSPFHPMYGGIRTWLLRHPHFPSVDPSVRLALASQIRAVDILHTHGHPVWVDLYRVAPRWNVRRIHTVHQVYDRGDARTPLEWRRLTLLNERMFEYCRTGNATIAVSSHVRRTLEDAGLANVVEIPPGIDIPELDAADAHRARERFQLPDEFVVFVGNTGAVKNPALAAEVAARLAPRPFVAVGAGLTVRGLREVGITAPINMVCLGALPHPDALDVMAAASAFFLSSSREGLSIATLEAMALGLPCAVPDLPGLRQATEDGSAARLYAPGLANEAAVAVQSALHDPALGRRAKASCRARFDWGVVSKQIDSLYESVMEGSA